jgi:hypothetical protein
MIPGHRRGMSTMLTPQQRRAKQRRDAADRARAYRCRHRVTGRPLPRDCDAALSEALSFWLEDHRRTTGVTVAPPDLAIPVRDLLKIARRILVDRSGLDRVEATSAIGRRVAPRREHDWLGYVPELPRRDA